MGIGSSRIFSHHNHAVHWSGITFSRLERKPTCPDVMKIRIFFQGENRFIESLCQKFIKLEDVFWVLNHSEIDNNLKSPFLKYLLWVYMNTAGSMIESGAAELPHER